MYIEHRQDTALIVAKIIRVLIGATLFISGLITYCCRRRRRNTGRVESRPVENSSYSNAPDIPPIPLPPPRTNNYQETCTQPPQPVSNAPSAADASDLPPSYDPLYAKQPPNKLDAH